MEISAEELKEILNKQNSALIDVRTQEEWDEGHIPGAIHAPLSNMQCNKLEKLKQKNLYIYCHSGARSLLACNFLNQAGFKVKNVAGGIKAWIDLGFEIEK